MLLIKDLKSSRASQNFKDFDNMFDGIDPEGFSSANIAIQVIDKVRLECNPSRSNDADIWFDDNHYPQDGKYMIQTSEYEEDSVGDIID